MDMQVSKKKLGLKEKYQVMTRGLDWKPSYQKTEDIYPYAAYEGIKIHDWDKWEDPFRLTMDAYWKYQAEKERKLYAIIDAYAQNNGHLNVTDARYINAIKLFLNGISPLEYMAHRGFAHVGRQFPGAGPRVACLMQSIDEIRHAQTQIHSLSNYNKYYNGFHEFRHMLERVERKVAVQFAIDAGEQIQIERSRHADRVVVGGDQHGHRLFEVSAEQQRVAGREHVADVAQKTGGRQPPEIADRAAEKQHEQRLVLGAALAHFGESREIVAFITDDRNAFDVTEFAAAQLQSGARYFNRAVRSGALFTERFEDAARLAAAAAAQFRDDCIVRQVRDDIARVLGEQALFGARHAVFGQRGDHFEKRRSHFIVEILRRQFLLGLLAEASANGGGEFRRYVVRQLVRYGWLSHVGSVLSRSSDDLRTAEEQMRWR